MKEVIITHNIGIYRKGDVVKLTNYDIERMGNFCRLINDLEVVEAKTNKEKDK